MRVLKFGGSSVGTPDRIISVLGLVEASTARSADSRVAVVLSAFQGVTDGLISVATTAARGDETFRRDLQTIESRHLQAVQDLIPIADRSRVLADVKVALNELGDIVHGISLIRELTRRTLDLVMSFGERLSCSISAEALRARGTPARFVDARQLVRTDESFGSAKVDWDETSRLVRERLFSEPGIPIVTGFIGSTEEGVTTTLGRGGSDYTAAILGAALDAEEIEIWTDVDGMLTADPRKVPKAFSLRAVTYEEAMELCHFGAKVIYPPTLQPAIDREIPISVRNTFNPDFPGTLIRSGRDSHDFLITGISSIEKSALVRIQGAGMVGVTGTSSRLFGALARKAINVILITQASSEHTICLAVDPASSIAAKAAIEEEFRLELNAKLLDPVTVEPDLSIVSVVGEGMRSTPGISGKLFSALGRNGVNVIAIAQGSSELNISVVIPRTHEAKALNALHDAFFLSGTKSLNLFIAGTGLIGKTLLAQVEAHRENLRSELSLDIRVIGTCNRSTMTVDGKQESANLERFIGRMKELNLPASVFIDCTASEDVIARYTDILESSVSIVTPNKKAQTGSIERYRELKERARHRNVELLYETSVGAGLPVLNTLSDLRRSGDTIVRIEAVLSGTLSFIFNSFDGAKPFSEIVRQAKELGYTEPDPRDDLNGVDFARKLLILARESGASIELGDVEIQRFLPDGCFEADGVESFFESLRSADADLAKRIKEVSARGGKLRYVGVLEMQPTVSASVELKEVGADHPFFGLSGSDNIISFTTARYRERPLVVKGPGAGAEVTAAGVFADVIRVARHLW